MAILILLILVVVIFILIYNGTQFKKNTLVSTNSNDYKEVSIDEKIYYQRLNSNTWNGQYYQKEFYTTITENYYNIYDTMEVVSFTKYLEKINSINSVISNKIKNHYYNIFCNYIILSNASGSSFCKMELIDCFEENNKIVIYGDEEVDGVMSSGSGFFIAIPTNMPVGTEIEYRECYTSSQINNLKEYGTLYDPYSYRIMIYKPIIYLYPTEDTKLTVNLGYEDKITCSYPQYTTCWNVLAKTSSDLIDLNTNRSLYALYYESESVYDFKIQKDGFIVRGSDVSEFLEEKLAILGLTEREAEEFIVYWLPQLQKNEYNYIRFATIEEINKNMPLEFSVEPDTLVRILMTYKGLDKPIDVEEQQLETPERKGFVAVEWGGTEIK